MRLVLPVLLLAATCAGDVTAQAIRRLPGFQRNSIPANDDGSSALVQLPFTVNFFGRFRGSAYVNNNGNITFDESLSTFTPFGLVRTQREIIAPFFADVDTRSPLSALVYYGEDTIDGRKAFGVNYLNVGYFALHGDLLNSFQVILIDRSDTGAGNFDVEFNYERIQWETGDASGGAGGRGGTPVVVGWSNGSGETGTSYEMAGSMISGQFLDGGPRALVFRRLNSPVLGRYVFRARNGLLSPGLGITSNNTLPRGVIGIPYSTAFTATGGAGAYRWTLTPDPGAPLPGLSMNAQGVLSGTPTARGSFEATLTVTSRIDNADESVSERIRIDIDAASLGVSAVSCPFPDALTGAPYSHSLRATGGAGPFLWSWGDESASPVPGLLLAENGTVSGTPTRPGVFRFPVRVSGPVNADTRPGTRICSVQVRSSEGPPAIQACPADSATAGVPYDGAALASGIDKNWRWAIPGGLPNGVTLSNSGRLSGIPASPGSFEFTLIAYGPGDQSIRSSCRLNVRPQEVSISTACPLPTGITGNFFAANLSAEGGEAPYTWSVSGTLPPGIALEGDGQLRGFPNEAGTWRFMLHLSDKNTLLSAKSCTLSVLRAPFSINACPLPDAQIGVPYSVNLRATGGQGNLRWNAETALPQGLTLLSTGHVTGTPSAPGDAAFHLSATDRAGNTASQQCRLFVRPQPLKIERPCPLADAQVGSFYRNYALAQGGVPPYRWSTESLLPAGVSLGEDGRFSGTPTAPGEYPFTLILEDFRGASMRKACSVAARVPRLPDLQLVAGSGTANIPVDLTLAKPYSLPITGDLVLKSTANTGARDAEVNLTDPAVQLLPGGRRVRFTIPAGERAARFRLATTGTVAAEHLISVEGLTIAGEQQVVAPAPVRLEVPRAVPTLSEACYTVNQNVLNIQITGLTPTRELTDMYLDLNGILLTETPLGPIAFDYFSNPLNARAGGTFRLDIPVTAEPQGAVVQVSSLKIRLVNGAGASAEREARRCN
jgi:hypothetical protein